MLRSFRQTLNKVFLREDASDVLRDQLLFAQRAHAEHAASAEHHAALAEMYRKRIKRVNDILHPKVTVHIDPAKEKTAEAMMKAAGLMVMPTFGEARRRP